MFQGADVAAESSTLDPPSLYLQKLPDHISVSLQQHKDCQVSSAAEVTGSLLSCVIESSESQLHQPAPLQGAEAGILCCLSHPWQRRLL